MRKSSPFFALAIIACAAAGVPLHASDALSGLRFSDGKERSFSDFPNQGVMVVYFCGHCPVAAAYLGKQIKALHDYIEERKVPVTLVLTTPDFGPAETVALNRDRSYHMDHALWASDPANSHNISLQNVYQVAVYGGDHRERDGLQNTAAVPTFETFFSSSEAGRFRYPADGLGDARVKEVWWQVERQQPDAVKNLAAAAKLKSSAQPELLSVLATVTTSLQGRQAELVAAPATFATYEGLEALLREGQGVDLKEAAARLKELGKDKAMKPELDARTAYRTCQTLLASTKPADQAAGKAGLPQIAKRWPDTAYGRRAAAGQ